MIDDFLVYMRISKILKDIRYVVFLITIYISTLFFSYMSLAGSGFSNELDTNRYILITGLFDALAIGLSIICTSHSTSKQAIVRILCIFLIALYYIEDGKLDWLFNSYIAFSLPCAFIGSAMAVDKSIGYFSKFLELIMLFVTSAILISVPYIFLYRTSDFEYQTYSYYAGFAYSVNLFYILYGTKYVRFKIFQKKIYSNLSIVLLAFQGLCCLMSGGRGGFMLVIFSTIILFAMNKQLRFRKILTIAVLLIIVFLLIPKELLNESLVGSKRTFSFLAGNKLDMSATSGRDMVYNKALNLIIDSPIFGYGIFRYVLFNKGTAHNIFLEVLLQGGIIYSMLFWIFFVKMVKKMRRMIKENSNNLFLLVIWLWPCVELLFSSSYMMFGLFWFVLSYIFVYEENKIKYL